MDLDFTKFRDAFAVQFDKMCKAHDHLFITATDKDLLWDAYLSAFPPGSDPMHRTRTTHDCSICRSFIRDLGNVVAITDQGLVSVWDFTCGEPAYDTVARAMSAYARSFLVKGRFLALLKGYGSLTTYANAQGVAERYDHFCVEVPSGHRLPGSSDSHASAMAEGAANAAVLGRSLNEISADAVRVVLELIAQDSIYRAAEWKPALKRFLALKEGYHKATDKNSFTWLASCEEGGAVTRMRNHSIGTLLVDIAEGVPLDEAVRKYEAIVAPTNYKRPKAVYTARMLEDAKAKLAGLGYIASLERRHATMDDITANNTVFRNRDAVRAAGKGAGDDVFSALAAGSKQPARRFDRVEEVGVDRFLSEIAPGASEIFALVEGRHARNLVSLVAPCDPSAKTMFKWGNGFSWSYAGNVADSLMRERVKSAGGKVDGDLRFSIQWNDVDKNGDDLDAHCIEPSGEEIFYGNRRSTGTDGELDVDIRAPLRGTPAVENITWASRRDMISGAYRLFVVNYANRGGNGGFRAEVEFDGQVHSYDYRGAMRTGDKVDVATVTLGKDGNFTIQDTLAATQSGGTAWGVRLGDFTPVTMVMDSPNHWDGQGVGNKHRFLMLAGCVNDGVPNAFYNEFLNHELEPHRHVMEALGSTLKVGAADNQLSGLGFSSTRRDSLVVKVRGASERVIRVMF